MKDAFGVFVIIGFWCSLLMISWIVRTISKFLEIIKYKAKLKKITPQVKAINTEELSSELISAKESYSSLVNLLQKRYGVLGEDEQVNDISKYIEETRKYRRYY
jgi:hypothetical protein